LECFLAKLDAKHSFHHFHHRLVPHNPLGCRDEAHASFLLVMAIIDFAAEVAPSYLRDATTVDRQLATP
jgi:hypothetical protein